MATKTPDRLAAGKLLSDPGDVDWSRYDFIDLGASKGGSLSYCTKLYGAGRGLGVEISERKAEAAAKAGHDVLIADASSLELEGVVRFVSMFDFLAQLSGLGAVESLLQNASGWATEFLTINNPSFEGEGFVEHLGFRQYWWDWTAHRAHPQAVDYCRMFESLELAQHVIRFRGPVADSSHSSIIPTDVPRNQGAYDPATHPPKPLVRFPRPLWRAQRITVATGDLSGAAWSEIVRTADGRSTA